MTPQLEMYLLRNLSRQITQQRIIKVQFYPGIIAVQMRSLADNKNMRSLTKNVLK
jgi:hypothetical protein